MKVFVQKTENASVTVNGKVVASSLFGLTLFVGFTKGDSIEEIRYLARKVAYLRIFDEKNIMDVGGSILSVSQFTLYADLSKGNRPSYQMALNREEALPLFSLWNQELSKYVPVQSGLFGEDMVVSLQNVGPMTYLLEKTSTLVS